MNILDENIPARERQLLEHWRVRVRQIGFNAGRQGMQDEEIIPLLLQLRRPTFVTRDEDFFDRQLCHSRYCVAFMAVNRSEVASFLRRALAPPRAHDR